MNGDEFSKIIFDKLSEKFPNMNVYAVGRNGVKNIVLFDEPELYEQKARYRIAFTNMLVVDGDTPLLGVETNYSTASIPPKNFVGSIPLYMITRKIIVRFENSDEISYDLDDFNSKMLLMIVLSEQKSKSKKDQLYDLNEKVRGIINLNSEFSYLRDFRICEVFDIDHFIEEMIV